MFPKVLGSVHLGSRSQLLALTVATLAAGLLGVRLIMGKGLGLRSVPRAIVHTIRSIADHERVAALSQGQYTNVLFLHHSTGELLIERGGLREGLTAAGLDFWDQSYNEIGLRNPAGNRTGYSYFVYQDNTDPDGLTRIFSQTAYDWPINTLSGLLQHEVIILKSCFLPANNIMSDRQLKEYQDWYSHMRDVMVEHPDKLFILLTTPPVNPTETSPAAAARAMQLARWLASDTFDAGHPNIAIFDLFSYLAETDPLAQDVGMLRLPYRNGGNSHPNRRANEIVGPILVDFIVGAIDEFRMARLEETAVNDK
jgi:hypothetical protein